MTVNFLKENLKQWVIFSYLKHGWKVFKGHEHMNICIYELQSR